MKSKEIGKKSDDQRIQITHNCKRSRHMELIHFIFQNTTGINSQGFYFEVHEEANLLQIRINCSAHYAGGCVNRTQELRDSCHQTLRSESIDLVSGTVFSQLPPAIRESRLGVGFELIGIAPLDCPDLKKQIKRIVKRYKSREWGFGHFYFEG